jgi:Cd2+/Zn2+-exporting ATPase
MMTTIDIDRAARDRNTRPYQDHEEVAPGTEVLSGSINVDGHLVVKLTRVGAESTLGRVIALLQEAEGAKPPVTRLLERYAERYMVLVLLLAAGAWFVSGSTMAMLAVLVASCPCALVLAAPATSIAAIAVASRHGILVKGAAFLENLATVDAVIFDKTGTVTVGQLRFVDARRRSRRLDAARGSPCRQEQPSGETRAGIAGEEQRSAAH